MSLKRTNIPPCGVCGSKKYRPSGAGTFVCGRGHIIAGIVQQATDKVFAPNQIRKKRRAGIQTAKKEEENKMTTIFSGEKAKLAFVKAYQFTLRLQVKYLIEACKVPPELEEAVRKFWGLYLDFNPNLQIDWSKIEGEVEDLPKKIPKENVEEDKASDYKSDDTASCSSEMSKDTSVASDGSEQEDSEDDLEIDDVIHDKFRELKRPTLRWSLVLLYIGFEYIRCPILAIDLIHLASLNKLPYVNVFPLLPAHYRSVKEMAIRLSCNIPSLRLLHCSISLMKRMLFKKYSVTIPQPVFPAVANRFLEHFHFPARIYPIIKNMVIRANPCIIKKKYFWPETVVAALLVIVFKCLYGLNGKTRPMHPAFINLPDLNNLLASMELANKKRKYELIPTRQNEILDLAWVRPNFVISTLEKTFQKPLNLEKGNAEAKLYFEGLIKDYSLPIDDLNLADLEASVYNLTLEPSNDPKAGEQYPLNDWHHALHHGQSIECCLLVKNMAAYFLDGHHDVLMECIFRIEFSLLDLSKHRAESTEKSQSPIL